VPLVSGGARSFRWRRSCLINLVSAKTQDQLYAGVFHIVQHSTREDSMLSCIRQVAVSRHLISTDKSYLRIEDREPHVI
jgi:hypothetical protein